MKIFLAWSATAIRSSGLVALYYAPPSGSDGLTWISRTESNSVRSTQFLPRHHLKRPCYIVWAFTPRRLGNTSVLEVESQHHNITPEPPSESFGSQALKTHFKGRFRIPVGSLAQQVCTASCSFLGATLSRLYVRSVVIKWVSQKYRDKDGTGKVACA